ncbi:hypothetical protein Ais01nite_14820 [Asanoa ishikariensis]|uniref:Uncharacterized membrane protein YoaK, UPF0700 family n=1 Tax=Asanoa ishikariensis TaxID=137265 RepID=A0A1H3UI55_9ACTN|nr:YoaK family protein [Asanoa ishikariensis]GIF63447.1 hypothetical protein Ais01nite_14820 [Asanoa ishikariensis]SDZ62153.1 Uncharacterized membrane protein YoaK, UPF0700 family [Asanoa ishikariensis]
MVLAGLARRGGRRVTPLSLAACAGVVDVVAFAGLGGAFASIVTGNLVVVGLGIGTADDHMFATPAVAVAGYSAGVLWAQATPRWRWPAHLVVELALLGALTAGWVATDGRPGRTTSLLLLATAGVAMGTQSVVAHRMHESTTYMTGTLTGALHDLVAGQRGRRAAALGQLAALAAGAVVAAVLFQTARWSVPLLAIGLLLLAIVAFHRP